VSIRLTNAVVPVLIVLSIYPQSDAAQGTSSHLSPAFILVPASSALCCNLPDHFDLNFHHADLRRLRAPIFPSRKVRQGSDANHHSPIRGWGNCVCPCGNWFLGVLPVGFESALLSGVKTQHCSSHSIGSNMSVLTATWLTGIRKTYHSALEKGNF